MAVDRVDPPRRSSPRKEMNNGPDDSAYGTAEGENQSDHLPHCFNPHLAGQPGGESLDVLCLAVQILLNAVHKQIDGFLVRFFLHLVLDERQTSLNLAAMIFEDAAELVAPSVECVGEEALPLLPVEVRCGMWFVHRGLSFE